MSPGCRVVLTYLARVNVKDLGGRRTSDSYISARVHLAAVNTLLPDNRHTVLYTIYTVWYLTEIIFAQSFLISVKGTVICPRALQVSTAKYRCQGLNEVN